MVELWGMWSTSSAERERSDAKDKGTGGQYVAVCSVSNSPLTHNPFLTLSQQFRIKCKRYIFLKCVRSSLLCWLCFRMSMYYVAIQHYSQPRKIPDLSGFIPFSRSLVRSECKLLELQFELGLPTSFSLLTPIKTSPYSHVSNERE